MKNSSVTTPDISYIHHIKRVMLLTALFTKLPDCLLPHRTVIGVSRLISWVKEKEKGFVISVSCKRPSSLIKFYPQDKEVEKTERRKRI